MSTQNHTDKVLCDADHVRELLRQRHLSQAELARIVLAVTIPKPLKEVTREEAESTRRTILRLFQGHRIYRGTAELIAKALGIEFRHLVVHDLHRGDSVEELISLIEDHDRHGEFERACQLGEQWREYFPIANPNRRAICVTLATVYDHAQQWSLAIERLDEWLNLPHRVLDETILRGHYQRAVIRRTQLEDVLHRTMGKLPKNQLRTAIKPIIDDLKFVRDRSEASMQVSVDHSFAVLMLLEGHFKKALLQFEQCLQYRMHEQNETPDERSRHRIVYEHRRIAQCQAMLGMDPTEVLDEAEKIADETQHMRLLNEIERDRHAWQHLRKSHLTN